MKTMLIALVLVISLVVIGQTTKDPEPCNFLSLQHPDWPPIPAPPSTNIVVRNIGGGEYIMEDRDYKYPEPPAPATNALAKARIKVDFNFKLDTNNILAHPESVPLIKQMIVDAHRMRTNGTIRDEVTSARRTLRMFDAIDSILATSTNTNAQTK